jgi:hypothetical protein
MESQDLSQPDSQFDFIMKDSQKPASGSGPKLPSGGLPKILILVGGGIFVLALIVVVVSLISGKNGGKWQPYVNLNYRAQEIVRVTDIVAGESKDKDTLAIAATTEAALNSQQNELTTYLSNNSVKINPKLGNPYQSTAIDDKLTAAQQNNTLDSTYLSYLKEKLGLYEIQIKAAAPGSGANGLKILKGDLASVQALLASPQLATSN